jgi:hypothetical protein
MFGNTGILRAVILQETDGVRVNVVKQKRINIWIFGNQKFGNSEWEIWI